MTPLQTLLRKAREAKGLSLQEAADALGVTKGHLHALEHDKCRNPTLKLVAAFVVVYGIDAYELVATGRSSITEPVRRRPFCWRT